MRSTSYQPDSVLRCAAEAFAEHILPPPPEQSVFPREKTPAYFLRIINYGADAPLTPRRRFFSQSRIEPHF